MKILGKSNLLWLIFGLGLLLAGYILLGRGPADNPLSLTYAPVLLVLAYCVIFPIAILKKNSGSGPDKRP